MKKENSIRATEIMIQIPPGDYTNTRRGKKLAEALSSDLSEFFRVTDNPSMFYVSIKHYLSERVGLNRMLPGDSVIEASIHATIVTLMTEMAATAMHEITNEKEDKPHKKWLNGVLKELKRTLKSKQRMKDFDKFCSDSYGVSVEKPGDLPNFASDDEDLDIHIDRHLNAKS
jgi:hypothetical protein|tara:strand:+ start:2319 stop:2834 length:516 start_codon:yes stop_codon:yes gene_type:complete